MTLRFEITRLETAKAGRRRWNLTGRPVAIRGIRVATNPAVRRTSPPSALRERPRGSPGRAGRGHERGGCGQACGPESRATPSGPGASPRTTMPSRDRLPRRCDRRRDAFPPPRAEALRSSFREHTLAGADLRGETVRGRRERARPAVVVRTRGVVREVEVEDEAAVDAAEIGALHGVEEIAPGAVRLAAARSVSERKE